MYLVGAKYQMEEPGAWRPAQVAKRIDYLEKEWANLQTKVPQWETKLREAQVQVRKDDKPLLLPAGLLATRNLKPVMVSARIEPRLSAGVKLWSLVPSDCAAEMAKTLPQNLTSPMWGGKGPLPG